MMNVNKLLVELEKVVKVPVVPDVYEGDKDRYIAFTYADERGALYADNAEELTEVTINVSYYCPYKYNYFLDKKKIKEALVTRGFNLEYIRNFVETAENGTERVRHIVFVVNYVGVDA